MSFPVAIVYSRRYRQHPRQGATNSVFQAVVSAERHITFGACNMQGGPQQTAMSPDRKSALLKVFSHLDKV